jgi:hypothetical protein
MENALIALVGVLIGILCSEHFRRNNRIEFYSQKVFDKRLSIHEELFSLMQNSYSVISSLMEQEGLSESERKDIATSVILPICEFTDKNQFYLDKYLSVQVASVFMGSEDVMGYSDPLVRGAERSIIMTAYAESKDMIISESGATEVFKHFKNISKSKPDSSVIRYMKSLEKNKV